MPTPVTGTAATIQDTQTVLAYGWVGGFVNPNSPNLTDFQTFLATSVEIPIQALPPTSPWPSYALAQALDLVNDDVAGILYTMAVYNCAAHIVFVITPDLPGQSYFRTKRGPSPGFGLVQPSSGLVSNTSDETTSTTIVVPEWAKKLTPTQLQFMRTPWGREFMDWNISAGPNAVGLT